MTNLFLVYYNLSRGCADFCKVISAFTRGKNRRRKHHKEKIYDVSYIKIINCDKGMVYALDKIKRILINIISILIFSLIISIFLDIIYPIYIYFSKIVKGVGCSGLFCEFITLIIGEILNGNYSKNELYNGNCLKLVLIVLEDIYKIIKNNSKLQGLLLICLILIISPAIAEKHLIRRLYAFGKEAIIFNWDAGKDAFFNYKYEPIEETIIETEPIEETIIEIEPIEETEVSNKLNSIETNPSKEDWINQHSEKDIEVAKRLALTSVEKDTILELSEDDYKIVYFEQDILNIIDWDDKYEINQKVKSKIDSLRNEHILNKFDDEDNGAPILMQNEISDASETDKIISSLVEKKRIMNIRLNAFVTYPKVTLAQLIAEDYNECGLSTYFNGGKYVTSKYYFSLSIIYFFESLKFESISTDTIKNTLLSISQRYYDIYYISILNGNEDYKAKKLSDAFKDIASYYGNEDNYIIK